MNYKVLEARHLSEKRRAERERDEARAAFDNATASLETALENMHAARAERNKLAEAVKTAVGTGYVLAKMLADTGHDTTEAMGRLASAHEALAGLEEE